MGSKKHIVNDESSLNGQEVAKYCLRKGEWTDEPVRIQSNRPGAPSSVLSEQSSCFALHAPHQLTVTLCSVGILATRASQSMAIKTVI